MKKTIACTSLVLLLLASCKKEATDVPMTQSAAVAEKESSVKKTLKWIDQNEKFPVAFSTWNPCTEEMVDFSGTGHLRIQGSVNENEFNFLMHYNAVNIQGIGRTSGTVYRTTDSFNYHNKGSFTNGEVVFQQKGVIRYTSQGDESDLYSLDDWHLTVNANGEVSNFRTTGGRIYECR